MNLRSMAIIGVIAALVIGVFSFMHMKSGPLMTAEGGTTELAYSDLLYRAMQVNSITFRPLEVYTCVALIFFFTLLTLSALAHLAEARLARGTERAAA